MRLYLAGNARRLPPIVLNLTSGVPFLKAEYVTAGYTKYDVMVIGGAGGKAGSLLIPAGDSYYGGKGGGGGSNLVHGNLSGLPSSCTVTIGVGGDDEDDITDEADIGTLNGGSNGGMSSFNITTAFARGGAGGTPPYIDGSDYHPGHGGRGGEGRVGTVGTGPLDADGTWNGAIGSGGCGGSGGSVISGVISEAAILGTRGSYDADDTSVFGPAGLPYLGPEPALQARPTSAGGAKATPLTGLQHSYGAKLGGSNGDGAVIIRLT